MSAENQIKILADYIMKEFPEKIVDGGAGDVAIAILKEYKILLDKQNAKTTTQAI